jgi:hypothetical protein
MRRMILPIVITTTILALVGVVGFQIWSTVADGGLSGHGYVAMALGVVFTLALGIGLMALVFYSHRRGYDDAVSSQDGSDERN